MIEKLKKLGYKGANNPLAIHMWLIIEKNIYASIYFSLFTKKWHLEKYFIDTKSASRIKWDGSTNQGFTSYKEACAFVVDVVVKML